MPVLARVFEDAGISTILVTNMPFWAEKTGTPRTLAVEYPFAHILGEPHNSAQQMRVILQALELLENAVDPGEIVHSDEEWRVPVRQAIEDWHPPEPPPLMGKLGPTIRQMIRKRRKKEE